MPLLYNENLNIKRLMLFSYVTFCLLNIHHPGFGELNPPYEYEVIEKYISYSQPGLISWEGIHILANKEQEPKQELWS